MTIQHFQKLCIFEADEFWTSDEEEPCTSSAAVDEPPLPEDSHGDEASQLSSSCAVTADHEPLFNDIEQAVEEASAVFHTAGLVDRPY